MELVYGIEDIFSATPIYGDMHRVLMGLIEKIDDDEYHGSKLRCLLAKWAYNGRYVLFPLPSVLAQMLKFMDRTRCGIHQEPPQTNGLQVYLD
jgi:hypothetical protein